MKFAPVWMQSKALWDLKLFPDHQDRAKEWATHLHASVHNNSFPMHSHRARVKNEKRTCKAFKTTILNMQVRPTSFQHF